MIALYVALAGLAGVLAKALFDWLSAKRATSGSTEQSNSTELWEEGRAIRAELREAEAALRAKVADLEDRLDASEERERAMAAKLTAAGLL